MSEVASHEADGISRFITETVLTIS